MSTTDPGETYHRSTRYESPLEGIPPPGEGRRGARSGRARRLPPPEAGAPETGAAKAGAPGAESGLSEALASRRSVRRYSDEPLSLETLSFLLWGTAGLSGDFRGAAGGTGASRGFDHRTAPSAGALFPIVTYVSCRKVDGLRGGVYRYDPREHSLEAVRTGDVSEELAMAALGQAFVARAAAVFVWTAVVGRNTAKYSARGYRYIYMEAGIASQNMALAAAAAGLGTCAVGAFYDDAVDAILGTDGGKEIVLLLQTVGVPHSPAGQPGS